MYIESVVRPGAVMYCGMPCYYIFISYTWSTSYNKPTQSRQALKLFEPLHMTTEILQVHIPFVHINVIVNYLFALAYI